ncbi:DUF6223 family protein [Sorangium sp. So ce590]|uniref:DUF6223 family protein n=1 Tax=unclassified Sorangium TaxID=2621164 RepID=UPI003F5EC362
MPPGRAGVPAAVSAHCVHDRQLEPDAAALRVDFALERRPLSGGVARSVGRIGTGDGRAGAIVALVLGLLAMVSGGVSHARS